VFPNPSFGFQAAFGVSIWAGCTLSTTSGACAAYSCPVGAPTGTPVSAGTIGISGGNLTSTTVNPETGGTLPGWYLYSMTSTTGFGAGQTLTASASGGVVPSWGPVSIVAPSPITLTSPDSLDGGALTIPTGGDLTVTWTGGVTGNTAVIQCIGTSATVAVECDFDAAAGQGTVPQAALTGLTGGGQLIFGQATSRTFSAGSFSINGAVRQFGGDNATYQ
jgi:hypothetical protein